MQEIFSGTVADIDIATVVYSDGTFIEIAIDDNALLLTREQAKELRNAIGAAIDWATEE